MLVLLWSACASGPTVSLPAVPAADPPGDVPVVSVTADGVWVDARPWSAQVANATVTQVDAWATATTSGMTLPGLDAALAALSPDPFTPALAVDAGVPFDRVARVLVTVGQRAAPGVEIRVTTPAGEGAVPYVFPTFCGASTDPAQVERLRAILQDAPTGPCLAPSVTEVDGGLRVELLQIPQDKPGCTVAVARPREPGATGWPDAVALLSAGACPSVPGADAAALTALLGRTDPLLQACRSGFVAMRGDTRWGDVVPVYAAVRARHGAASLGIAGAAAPDCARGFVLP
jgi:hypothetical protein